MAAALGRRVGAVIGATISGADRTGSPVPRERVWRKDRHARIKKILFKALQYVGKGSGGGVRVCVCREWHRALKH